MHSAMRISACVVASVAVAFIINMRRGTTVTADSTTHMLAVMYTVLHDLALPNFNASQPITERFILMLPGEVLNYYDYCPLSESKGEFNPNDYNSFPPDENSFRLSDTVPTLNPLGGGTTGKQLSTIYENILYTIDTSTTESDPFSQQSYTNAIKYLTELVSDPQDNSAPNVSRYELYYRYQKDYYDMKMQVKEWFDGNKTKLSYEEYMNWYKENYNSLMGYVSSSYTRWLVSGLKGPVEDRISLVDIKSDREIVEEARQAMRAEEEPSLDGGSKYYPVHFVPSNWYHYLLASDNQLTTDQIQAKIGDLTARRDQVQAMMGSNIPTSDELTKIKKNADSTLSNEQKKMNDMSQVYACYRYLCQAKRTNSSTSSTPSNKSADPCSQYDSPSSDPCSKVNDLQTQLNQQSEAVAQAQTAGNSAMNQLNAYTGSNGSLMNIIQQLNDEIANLQQQLSTAPKPIPPDVEKAKINGTGHLSPQEIEENWMSFSYDSETSSSSTVTSSTTYKAAVSFSASGLAWSVSGSASYSRSTQDFAKKMSSAQVTISAKLLKVTIERNWFRPSLFNVGKLQMELGINPVSPGPIVDESNYITKAKGHFQLPEYTSGFLLAKDVSMSFRGVDSSTVSHALQESASASLSGSYGPFSASASFSYGHQSSNLKVSSQANGLKIDIPGAQVIGYYTSVLPKFPANDK